MKLTLTIFLFFCVFGVKAQTITTFAGGSTSGICEGCPATSSVISDPGGGVFDKYGNYYFASSLGGDRLRKIDARGIISTVAGNGINGFSGDGGPATVARLNLPTSARIDLAGNFLIADFGNNRIRKVNTPTGIITTLAGTGIGGYNGDNIPATTANFTPREICIDKSGNIIIADYNGRRVRKIDAAGIITTIAGVGTVGSSGDGGPATAAELNPNSIAMDDTGNFYIADPYANVVRKINTVGIISTVAGSGAWVYSGDGVPATNADIQPTSIAIDSLNNILIGDRYNKMVYKVNTSGILYRIAGNGMTGFSGDGGPATAASVDYPSGVATDACGNLYIPEAGNQRIRKVASGTTITPTISITSGTSYASGSTVTVTAAVTDTCASYLIHWLNKGVVFATTTTTSVTYTKGAGIDTITARVVPQCGSCYDSTTSLKHIVYNTALGVHGVGVQPVRVYPNPAQGELTITAGTKITGVTISNIIGRQVYSHEYNTENVTMNIAQLPAGVYTLKITGEGWQEVRRVVKE